MWKNRRAIVRNKKVRCQNKDMTRTQSNLGPLHTIDFLASITIIKQQVLNIKHNYHEGTSLKKISYRTWNPLDQRLGKL